MGHKQNAYNTIYFMIINLFHPLHLMILVVFTKS